MIRFSKFDILPTLNGILVSADSSQKEILLFVNMEKPYEDTRVSTKAFSVMHEKFVPLMTISPLGVADNTGSICAPCKLECVRTSDRNFIVKITPLETAGQRMLIEINMYEPKLMLDTTVDSKNEDENNAFGSVAFIGTSHGLGEQLLYSRVDISKIGVIQHKTINYAKLHIPYYGNSKHQIDAFRVGRRFCSFGSTWSSKVSEGQKIGSLTNNNGYMMLDLSKLIINPINRQLTKNEGYILQTTAGSNGFTVMSTGDSTYKPQVLEINYK